jgi:hypothetical protein
VKPPPGEKPVTEPIVVASARASVLVLNERVDVARTITIEAIKAR